jgi:hypothetical protein
MQHITLERIAALADEPATLPERAHLAGCSQCTAELVAAQRIVQMAMTDTPAIERPVTSWERLGPALRAEGLITTSMAAGRSARDVVPIGPPPRRVRYRWPLQAAAGVLLAVGGAVIGRASASLPVGPLASGGASASDTTFRSTADATSVLQRSYDQYQRAVVYLAVNDSSVTLRGRDAADLYQARLDVLDRSVAATRAALYRAPQDPVLNQYYLQTQGARNLTLQQLGQAVPVVAKRTRF